MIHIDSSEIVALHECTRALETVLNRLDRIGAGIAAIHVDAAINQLHSNLESIEVAQAQSARLKSTCQSEQPIEFF